MRHDSTTGLADSLFDAQVARENAENAHRSQPGANLLDAYRISERIHLSTGHWGPYRFVEELKNGSAS